MENDSTQGLYRDWLQKLLSSSPSENTYSTVKNESRTAFQLFAEASCNLDEKIALLLQELGPAFQNTDEKPSIIPLFGALNCLSGALEGIGGRKLSSTTVTLLGKFIIEFCAPIQFENDDNDDDFDDKIRDEAVKALILLLKSVNVYDNHLHNKDLTNAIRMWLQFGQSGVEKRCGTTDVVMEGDDDNEYEREKRNRDGLSRLPRSRRSLCFDLLRSSVESVQVDLSQLSKTEAVSIEKDLVRFAIFVSTCLHGESDPRCLIQLLELLCIVMKAFLPYFTLLQSPAFPLSDYFDAVAPYYPVQFTPPPNNVYGITKTSIRNAVLAVLVFTEYDSLAEKFGRDSMRSYALGIIVETLAPPEDDGPQTIKEKLEALEDLRFFLFANEKSKVQDFKVPEAKQLSDTLLIVHDEASKGVAGKASSDEDGKAHKQLADLCRITVSRIALETEESGNPELWDAFVKIPISTMASSLQSLTSELRTTMAYLANLCSCGGIATLRVGLEAGLAPILKTGFTEKSLYNGDEDILCVRVWAVGAFFASARVTLEKLQLGGVSVSPHPLLDFSSTALQAMFTLLLDERLDIQIRVAAIRATEAIVSVTPQDQYTPDLLEEWNRLIRSMQTTLYSQETSLDYETKEANTQWKRCLSETLGLFVGMTLDSRSKEHVASPRTVFYIEDIQNYFVNDVLHMLVQSVTSKTNGTSDPQLTLRALVKACSFSYEASFHIVALLMKQLLSLAENGDSFATSYAEALSFLFSHDKNYAGQVFQKIDSPVNVFDIISTMCPSSNEESTMDVDGMSRLQLPPNADEKAKFRTSLVLCETIVSHLRTAYESIVLEDHVKKLASYLANCLPPLSDADLAKTSITLPLLSLALYNCDYMTCRRNMELCTLLLSMISDLADLATNSTNIGCRRHATQCLYVIIAYFAQSASDCPAKRILDDVVLVAANAILNEVKIRKNFDKAGDFSDVFSILAVLGAAAMTRGGSSHGTSDLIMRFLLDLACQKFSELQLGNDALARVDLRDFDDAISRRSDSLSLHAATSFGLMLASVGGGPLCKQRCSHLAMKHILKDVDMTESKVVSTGVLCAVCHVVSAGTIQKLSPKTVKTISELVLSGLRFESLESCSPNTTKLLLSSIIRIFAVAPSAFDGLQYFVVVGAMRAIAETNYDDSDSGIACKLLALQVLDIVAKQGGTPKLKSKLKTAVVSILGVAVNHRSALFRQAAVEVRNTWYLLA